MHDKRQTDDDVIDLNRRSESRRSKRKPVQNDRASDDYERKREDEDVDAPPIDLREPVAEPGWEPL